MSSGDAILMPNKIEHLTETLIAPVFLIFLMYIFLTIQSVVFTPDETRFSVFLSAGCNMNVIYIHRDLQLYTTYRICDLENWIENKKRLQKKLQVVWYWLTRQVLQHVSYEHHVTVYCMFIIHVVLAAEVTISEQAAEMYFSAWMLEIPMAMPIILLSCFQQTHLCYCASL